MTHKGQKTTPFCYIVIYKNMYIKRFVNVDIDNTFKDGLPNGHFPLHVKFKTFYNSLIGGLSCVVTCKGGY